MEMEQGVESRGGSDAENVVEAANELPVEIHTDLIRPEGSQDEMQVGRQEIPDAKSEHWEHGQGMSDEAGDNKTVEDEAEMVDTEAMDADQDVTAGGEHDHHEPELNEKEVMADEPGPDSCVEDEAAGEDNADAKSPLDDMTVQLVREKRKIKSLEDEIPAGLPVTRVKRIIKLDPDIRLVSKEGISCIIHATQHFLEALAAESILQAWKSKRKGVKADDILVAARSSKFRDCLGTTLSDFVKHLRKEDSDVEDGESGDESEREESNVVSKKDAKRKCLQRPPNNRSITDFF